MASQTGNGMAEQGMAIDFDHFVQQAWAGHADAPLVVARRIDELGFLLLGGADDATALARLITHVWGEHLGQWLAGIERLERLGTQPAGRDLPELRRSRAVLELAAGLRREVGELSLSDQARAWCGAATALVVQGLVEAGMQCFDEALALAQLGFEPDDPALRALAVAGNNLACTLESRPQHTASERDAMLAAAGAARQFWSLAGGWLEVERAEYRLARAHLRVGHTDTAALHAEECLALCLENGADAYECFFAYEVLALACAQAGAAAGLRAAIAEAEACHERLNAGLQAETAAVLAALRQLCGLGEACTR